MAGSKTDYIENEVAKLLTGQASIFGTAWVGYLGLLTSSPTEAAPGTAGEVAGGLGYARKQVTSFFGAPSGGTVVNTGTINFGTSTGAWGTVSHVGYYMPSTGGTCWWYADLTTPVAITSAGIAFQFDPVTNTVTLTEV
jgi:hypothetical protein